MASELRFPRGEDVRNYPRTFIWLLLSRHVSSTKDSLCTRWCPPLLPIRERIPVRLIKNIRTFAEDEMGFELRTELWVEVPTEDVDVWFVTPHFLGGGAASIYLA